MVAYVIFTREGPVKDEAEMAEYKRKNREHPRNPNMKPLCVYGSLTPLEGDGPDGVVVLEFPTVDDAKAWYDSPGYQDSMQHRRRGADYRAFIVEGL